MKKISTGKKTGWIMRSAAVFAVVVLASVHSQLVWAAPVPAAAVSDNIIVREEAVSGAQVGSLYADQEVTITDEKEGSDGKVWYNITFEGNGEEMTGWVRSDLVEKTENAADEDTSTDTGDITQTTGVRIEMADGYVDLIDVPSEQASLVSDRFVLGVCDLEGGSVQAYQLASPDELVSADADLTTFYYVYGINELGEQGWYTYDIEDGTLQKSLTNMQYSVPSDQSQETNSEGNDGILNKMVIGGAGLICILLLVLVVIISVRYRRLRKLLEEVSETSEEDSEEWKTEMQNHRKEVRTERKKAANGKASGKAKEEVHMAPFVENDGYDLPDDDSYDVYDLDDLDRILDGEKVTGVTEKVNPEQLLEEGEAVEASDRIDGEDVELERILLAESQDIFGLKEDKQGKNDFGSKRKRTADRGPEEKQAEKKTSQADSAADLPEDIEFVDDGIDDEDLEFL